MRSYLGHSRSRIKPINFAEHHHDQQTLVQAKLELQTEGGLLFRHYRQPYRLGLRMMPCHSFWATVWGAAALTLLMDSSR